MNVLSVVVAVAARSGGTAAFVGESACELRARGHTLTVLTTDLALAPTGWLQRQRRLQPSERHPSLTNNGAHVFPARFPRRLAFSPGLRRVGHALAPSADVVHLHNLWQYPQFAGYRAARAFGVPYIVSPHGALDPFLRRHGRVRKRLSMAFYQERLLREAALIHVTTSAEAELMADLVPDVPRVVVPCGMHVEDFQDLPPRERFRSTHLNGYDGPVILFLGRVTYKKGIDVLIRALSGVQGTRDARLVIAGPDDEGLTRGLTGMADDLGVGARVTFTGPLYGEDRLAALSSADVWALSSHAENFGIAVIEAMAAGCAVCVSDAVNVSADIAAAGAGVVARPTAHAFGEAIEALLVDEPRRERLRARAPHFAAGYDWSRVTPALVDMYERAASSRTQPRLAAVIRARGRRRPAAARLGPRRDPM